MSGTLKRRMQGFKAFRPMLSRARRFALVGPMRPVVVGYYRMVSHPEPLETHHFDPLEPFPIEETIDSLLKNGVATGLKVSQGCVDQLLKCYESKPNGTYQNPHIDHEVIRDISRDERLIKVARAYLGSEPILLSSMMHTYTPESSSDADYFHFDVGDALTLTLFIYLTDVDNERGVTHELIPGTHKTKSFKELWDCTLSDKDADAKFPGQVQTVLGPRGTTWLEDVQVFHKHGHVGQCRKMLSLQYSLHRQP